MLLTIIKHDCKALKYQSRMVIMNIILVLGLCVLMYIISHYGTSGVLLFGQENLQLVFVILLGISSCVEFLGQALLSDIDDGTRSTVFYCGINPIEYVCAKAIMPLCISIINITIFYLACTVFLPVSRMLSHMIGSLAVAYVIDLFLCVSVTSLISIFVRPDTKSRPNYLFYITLIHFPILFFCNPTKNLSLFSAVVVIAAAVSFVGYAVAILKKYQSNIGCIDDD